MTVDPTDIIRLARGAENLDDAIDALRALRAMDHATDYTRNLTTLLRNLDHIEEFKGIQNLDDFADLLRSNDRLRDALRTSDVLTDTGRVLDDGLDAARAAENTGDAAAAGRTMTEDDVRRIAEEVSGRTTDDLAMYGRWFRHVKQFGREASWLNPAKLPAHGLAEMWRFKGVTAITFLTAHLVTDGASTEAIAGAFTEGMYITADQIEGIFPEVAEALRNHGPWLAEQAAAIAGLPQDAAITALDTAAEREFGDNPEALLTARIAARISVGAYDRAVFLELGYEDMSAAKVGFIIAGMHEDEVPEDQRYEEFIRRFAEEVDQTPEEVRANFEAHKDQLSFAQIPGLNEIIPDLRNVADIAAEQITNPDGSVDFPIGGPAITSEQRFDRFLSRATREDFQAMATIAGGGWRSQAGDDLRNTFRIASELVDNGAISGPDSTADDAGQTVAGWLGMDFIGGLFSSNPIDKFQAIAGIANVFNTLGEFIPGFSKIAEWLERKALDAIDEKVESVVENPRIASTLEVMGIEVQEHAPAGPATEPIVPDEDVPTFATPRVN